METLSAELLATKEIDYPSGSALSFYKDQLYLMGDDATGLLVLDTALNILKTIPMFPQWEGRVAKSVKADIESADIARTKNGNFLYLFGSGSKAPYRDNLYKVNLETATLSEFDLSVLYRRIKEAGAEVLNIEASAFLGKKLLLGNRSNRAFTQNYLIYALDGFESYQEKVPLKLIPLIPDSARAGISGMAYYARKDFLFITFSEEETQSAYSDGEVGESYIGIIQKISKKLNNDTLRLDGWYPLSQLGAEFKKVKVESITPGRGQKDGFVVFLAADNDDGRTILYKLKLKW